MFDDHDWPAELDGSRCYKCGLEFDQWIEEDPGCPGEPEEDDSQ